MEIDIKRFSELNTDELYDILQLRSEVFVVEQDCVYQDLDGKDKKALHIIGRKNDVIVAYTRVFKAGEYFEEASIGRVVVRKNQRSFGYGEVIMKASIKAIETSFDTKTIRISAQQYLMKFYSSLGFQVFGEGYLEDGIPHIGMIKK
ncbi:ElaA protein [Arenibacter nanhaiticus]|uniref:ElaA protein n=1 Tax=Arenibacter nanhaiticus TaxID=558155 RepID=A0A1M6LU36_9FLAO|nr:GNAT family N-acetyltransferase [Arenibacter nanhaiticus]SHJ74635.1 ElaA protein [Arenibacter nanhaiticus]